LASIFGWHFLAGIFWPAVWPAFFARRAHTGPTVFFASVSPFQKGKGLCRQTLLRGTP
jgi:hypothetical protein